MKQKEEMISIMEGCGLSRVQARCLYFLLEVKNCEAQDIERAMNLRQPEVSSGLRELMEKGFVQLHSKIKCEGKGRPRNLYAVQKTSQIHAMLKKNLLDRQKEIEKRMKDIDKLFPREA